MLLKIDNEKVVILLVMLGLVALAGQAHARLDDCGAAGQKTLRCVLNVS